MRAILLTDEEIKRETLSVEGDRFRHLVQVCRLKVGDDILLLDGRGHRARGEITEIKKRDAELNILDLEFLENTHTLCAFIGCPKKDAVEEIIRRGTELGLRKIIFYESEFSTFKYAPNSRFDKIIESALIQSNNFWAPTLQWCDKDDLEKVLGDSKRAILLHPYPEAFTHPESSGGPNRIDMICIGPEAGWSELECERISKLSNVEGVRLATPILRAEHALSVAAGYALSQNDN